MVTEPASRRPQEDRPADLPETRAVIEQATEILMAMYRCGPGEALELLRRASQDGNVKAHVLAATLVDLAKRGLMAMAPSTKRPSACHYRRQMDLGPHPRQPC